MSLYMEVVTRIAPLQLSLDGWAKTLFNNDIEVKIAISNTNLCNFFFMTNEFLVRQISFSGMGEAILLVWHRHVKIHFHYTIIMVQAFLKGSQYFEKTTTSEKQFTGFFPGIPY